METQLRRANLSPPPWEVLVLVAHHLDPKTLAIASCVSKSWSHSMSSDHLWKPILAAHFPSLSTLPRAAIPYCRLFALGHSTAVKLRRHQNPSKPYLSLGDLLFTVSIISMRGDEDSHRVIASMTKPGDALRRVQDTSCSVFHFSIDMCDGGGGVMEESQEVKVIWNVVLKGWRGVFTMMDCKGKVGGQGWFSQELPAPGCCSSKAVASSVVADLKIDVCGCEGSSDGKVRVHRVSLGILSVVDWRYIGVDDGLRYLQHFIPTCN